MENNKLRTVFNFLGKVSVEPYLFFCIFSYTVRLASFQSLLMEQACLVMHNYDDKICHKLSDHPKEQAKSMETGNNLYMGVMLLSSLPAVGVAIFLGPWSDKYSRKYPLIISATGIFLECATSAIIVVSPNASPVWYVAVAALSGFSGGFIMSSSSAFSYLADITDERSRPARYAILEFSMLTAVCAGTFLGGQLYKIGGYLAPMIASPSSALLSVLYAVFAVHETKPKIPEGKGLDVARDLFQCNNLKESFKTCTRKRPGNLRLQIWCLVCVSCSHRFVEMGTISIEFPFSKKMYDWDVTSFSNAFIIYSVTNALVTLVVVPVLSKVFKLHEAAVGAIGILSMMAKMILCAVAFQVPVFFYGWVAGTMNNFAPVAVRSRLSKLVTRGESGRAFSLLATCESLTPLLGTVVFIQVYNASVLFFPGLAFTVAGVFLIPSLIVFLWMMKMPTVSLAEFAQAEDEAKYGKPLETLSHTYSELQEEKS